MYGPEEVLRKIFLFLLSFKAQLMCPFPQEGFLSSTQTTLFSHTSKYDNQSPCVGTGLTQRDGENWLKHKAWTRHIPFRAGGLKGSI